MPRRLKRRSEGQPEASPPRSPVRRRPNEEEEAQSEHDSEEVSEGETPAPEDGEPTSTDAPPQQQMIKKLVRLALATEFSRQPLRRSDILTKVLDPHNRSFKPVFSGAQKVLRSTFGMQLVELPSKEKVTLAQKRAAQRAGGSQTSTVSNAWILTTTLPSHLRSATILPPARNPSAASEAEYVGLYSFVVSVIYLSQGGRLSEGKLERYLARMQAAEYVPDGSKTDDVLKRMEKQGYIVRVREREPGGEETVDWILGPRGKVEVGEKGVAGLVRTVYGVDDADLIELEDRLERNLGVGSFKRKGRIRGRDAEEGEEGEGAADEDDEEGRDRSVTVGRPVNGRGSGMIDDAAEEDDDDEEEDEEDEESE